MPGTTIRSKSLRALIRASTTRIVDSKGTFVSSSPTIKSPRLAFYNIDQGRWDGLVSEDRKALEGLFGAAHLSAAGVPDCDVLFLYCTIEQTGKIAASPLGLGEIIRDSGAKIVVVAAPNPGKHYIAARQRAPYGRANIVMTVDRFGEAFPRFFSRLFAQMFEGVSMPVAWVTLSPQVPEGFGGEEDNPETVFACELGQMAFRR